MTEIEAVELRHVALPLIAPFRTATGAHTTVEKLLIRCIGAESEGWGECPVGLGPGSVPSVVTAWSAVCDAPSPTGALAAPVAAALEAAHLDADLRRRGISFADHLGATRDAVDAGVAVGIASSIDALLEEVTDRVDEGYRRVKLKIEPGWDVEPVAAVREQCGNELMLQVDANGAYGREDAPHLRELDRFSLLMIEQPLPPDDLEGHAGLARQIDTPICLDESIESFVELDRALAIGACAIVNVKPSRLGGVLAARAVHDRCFAAGVPVWCGGMLETGIGRALNIALAALPGFTFPGDLSASHRYFATDLTAPFVLDNGRLRVPHAPGLGVDVLPEVLDETTIAVEVIRPG